MYFSALLVLINCFKYDSCSALVPEVSQEGLLRPYVSYSDVTLLHYHLPQQLATATWEFAAFMDDPGCPTRIVHVLLQHGSYPLVSPHNDTFAPYMYDERSSLHKVSTVTGYRPHDATLLALDSPLPGSWYAAAYIPHWDQQMQQEGLIHKCRYSLGSIAMWRQQDPVHTLHPGRVTQVVTRRNLEYYRFYVPSHTWLLKVAISGCERLDDRARAALPLDEQAANSTDEGAAATDEEAGGGGWCIRWAGLRARALPHYDLESPGAVNVSSGDGHVFREERPYTDSYYYLLLYTEGQTSVTLSISTRECGGVLKEPHSRMLRRSTKSVLVQEAQEQDDQASSTEKQRNTHTARNVHGKEPDASEQQPRSRSARRAQEVVVSTVKSSISHSASTTQKPILDSPAHAINISAVEAQRTQTASTYTINKKAPSGSPSLPREKSVNSSRKPNDAHPSGSLKKVTPNGSRVTSASEPLENFSSQDGNFSSSEQNPSWDIQSSSPLKSANSLGKSVTFQTDRHENIIRGYEEVKKLAAAAAALVAAASTDTDAAAAHSAISKNRAGGATPSELEHRKNSPDSESVAESVATARALHDAAAVVGHSIGDAAAGTHHTNNNINDNHKNSVGRQGYSQGTAVHVSGLLQVEATVSVFTDRNSTAHRDNTSSSSSRVEGTEYGAAGDDYSSSFVSQADDVWASSEAIASSSLATEDELLDEDDDEEEFTCYPVLPLARIKHAMDFTDTFLIQGPEWYSTWVSVRADSPVFTHLTLLPHTDIGGTLTIALHLDPLLQNATHQLVTVEGCARKGRAPPLSPSPSRLSCSPHLSLQATSLPTTSLEDGDEGGGGGGWWWNEEGDDAKLRSAKNLLLVPFPEPDEWYLGLMVVCYSDGIRAPCSLSEVVVSVEARTQPCLYAGAQPCGPHGSCIETHKGLMAYSSCKCAGGWRGWGCQERADSPGYSLTGVLLLTLSNGFFVPPIMAALRCRLPSHALLYAATMLASVLYHLCDNQVVSYCVSRYEVLQFTDFFFSLLCFWVTVVGLAPPLTGYCSGRHTRCTCKPLASAAPACLCCFSTGRSSRSSSPTAAGGSTASHSVGSDGSSTSSTTSTYNTRSYSSNTTCTCPSDNSSRDSGHDSSSTCDGCGSPAHSSSLSGVWHTLGVVVIAPCVQYSRTALASFAIPMALAATVPLGSILWRWWKGAGWPRLDRGTLLWRGVGGALALTGLAMFALVQTKQNYKFVHSFWHSTIALSLLFLLPLSPSSWRCQQMTGNRKSCSTCCTTANEPYREHQQSQQPPQQQPQQPPPPQQSQLLQQYHNRHHHHQQQQQQQPSQKQAQLHQHHHDRRHHLQQQLSLPFTDGGSPHSYHGSSSSMTGDPSRLPRSSSRPHQHLRDIHSDDEAPLDVVFASPPPESALSTTRASDVALRLTTQGWRTSPPSDEYGSGRVTNITEAGSGGSASSYSASSTFGTKLDRSVDAPSTGDKSISNKSSGSGLLSRLLARSRLGGARSSVGDHRVTRSAGFRLTSLTDEDAELLDVTVDGAVDYTVGGVDVRGLQDTEDVRLIQFDDCS